MAYEDSYCYKARYSEVYNFFDLPRELAALRLPRHTEIIDAIIDEELSRPNVDPEKALQDAMDNWEYDSQFHTCWHCKKSGIEEGMHKNSIGYWVHDTCELLMEESIKYLKY